MLGQLVVKNVFIASIAMDGCTTFGRDSAQLQGNTMLRLIPVVDSVIVSTGAIVVTTTAAEMAAVHAEPEI